MTTAISDSRAESTAEPVHVDGVDHLEALVDEHDVVLVDFFATWCGPCKQLEPILEELAAETDAVIAEVDVEEHQGLAADHAVRSVPTLALFAGGEQVEQLIGVQTLDRLRSLIDEHAAE